MARRHAGPRASGWLEACKQEPAAIRIALVALIGAVVICAGLLLPPLWSAAVMVFSSAAPPSTVSIPARAD